MLITPQLIALPLWRPRSAGNVPDALPPLLSTSQVLLGTVRIVSSEQMLSGWRYVVVGSTMVAAVLTPSTDPFTQLLLAVPLVGLYVGGALAVKTIEAGRLAEEDVDADAEPDPA